MQFFLREVQVLDYGQLLEKDMAPYSVIQRGFGGSKLSDFAVYADRIFAPHPCKAIVLFVANDITRQRSG